MIEKQINDRFDEYIFNWDYKDYFVFGGYGSSKSYHTALKIFLKLMQEKRKCLVIREVYETMKESCFALFVDIIEDLGLSKVVRSTESPMKIKFPNGSTIIFRGMDKPAKLKSIHDVSIVWLEEASEIKYEGFKEVRKRIRHPTLDLHIILSTNPVSQENWVYTHFFKDELNDRFVIDDEDVYEQKTVIHNGVYYHHSTADDNMFLPQSYIDELEETKEYDPDLYVVARHGRFGAHGERVLPNYEDMNETDMDRILAENGNRFMFRAGMDFGFVTSYNALYRVAVDKVNQYLYIYWEYYDKGKTDDITCKDIAEFRDSGELITADSEDPKAIQYYRQQGFKMRGAKKFPGSRLANTRKMRRFKKIFVSSACKNARRELKTLTFKKDRNGKLILDDFNIDPHSFSALWYALDGYEVPDLKGKTNGFSKSRLGL